jgi:hypothetical protein
MTDLDPVITATTNIPPISPIIGDRYLIPSTPAATGTWIAKENQIAEWDGTTWIFIVPVADNVVFVTDTLTTLRYNGTTWVSYKGVAILQNGNRLTNHINIGSNDYYNLNFKTNNIQRMSILRDGDVGIGLTATNARLHVKGTTASLGTTVFKVDGNSGELFSVVDDLTGSLMSVNDISGLPVLEVFADNTVLMGDYQAPSLYTTIKASLGTTPTFTTICQVDKTLYSSAFFEYNVKSSSNMRAGTVMAVWDGTNVEFTETSTIDLGNTQGVVFQAIISGSYLVLQAKTTSSGWTIKSIIRAI